MNHFGNCMTSQLDLIIVPVLGSFVSAINYEFAYCNNLIFQ